MNIRSDIGSRTSAPPDGSADTLGVAARAQSDGGCEVDVVDTQAVEDVRTSLPSQTDVASLAETFSALGDPTRLLILTSLARRELCVCDLASITGISQSGVSHQLRLLRQMRLVSFTRDGRRAVYRLNDDHVRSLLDLGMDHVTEPAAAGGPR